MPDSQENKNQSEIKKKNLLPDPDKQVAIVVEGKKLDVIPSEVIPHGCYCYSIVNINKNTGTIETKTCPFWDKKNDKPAQENGYCHFLERGDWESNYLHLLFDQVKECHVNLE